MISLLPFTESDFNTFKSWIIDEEQLFQFAGTIFSYPVTNEQLQKYIQMTDRKPFKVILNSTKETIGHCEMNFENGNNRLSRILVANQNLRGQKIGENIVRNLTNKFFSNNHIEEVDLNVFDWNKNAIRCYEKVGFKIDQNQTTTLEINNKQWILLNMKLKKKAYNML